MNNKQVNLFFISFVAGLGGFLFGFDTAVISGAIGFLQVKYDLTVIMEGWVMSSALFGSILGAAISGYLSDKFGRKNILLLSALLFLLSAFGSAIINNPLELTSYRIIGGVGVGIAAMVSPLYISELAPSAIRGRLVSFYQLSITIGIFISYVTNILVLNFSNFGHLESGFLHNIFIEDVWRAMFAMEVIPAGLFFMLLLIVPESPRYLMNKGYEFKSLMILEKVHGEIKANLEFDEIKETLKSKTEKFTQYFKVQGFRRVFLIGLVIALMSQLTGITTVMYYAPDIFNTAGLKLSDAFGGAAIIGLFNIVSTIVAILKIDQVGRKKLLMFGFLFLGIILVIIGLLFNISNDGTNTILLISFVLYICVFAATIGPGFWVLISELFPTKIRGRTMAIATLTVFTGSLLVTQTFPFLRSVIGLGPTFWIYGFIMFPASIFIWKIVPETKGKTLEEIENSIQCEIKKTYVI